MSNSDFNSHIIIRMTQEILLALLLIYIYTSMNKIETIFLSFQIDVALKIIIGFGIDHY
jgi:hypothetical protein